MTKNKQDKTNLTSGGTCQNLFYYPALNSSNKLSLQLTDNKQFLNKIIIK